MKNSLKSLNISQLNQLNEIGFDITSYSSAKIIKLKGTTNILIVPNDVYEFSKKIYEDIGIEYIQDTLTIQDILTVLHYYAYQISITANGIYINAENKKSVSGNIEHFEEITFINSENSVFSEEEVETMDVFYNALMFYINKGII
jgi:hypothetical protein